MPLIRPSGTFSPHAGRRAKPSTLAARSGVDRRRVGLAAGATVARDASERIDRRARGARAVAVVGAGREGDGAGHAPQPPFRHLVLGRGAKGKAAAPLSYASHSSTS